MKVPVFKPSVSSLIDELPEKEFEITHYLNAKDEFIEVNEESLKVETAVNGRIMYVMYIGDVDYHTWFNSKMVYIRDSFYVVYFKSGEFWIVKGEIKED